MRSVARVNRPVERIEPMLALVRQAWLKYPDQRLGQIIGNAARDPEVENWAGHGEYRDPFNIEDDAMWEGLRRMVSTP